LSVADTVRFPKQSNLAGFDHLAQGVALAGIPSDGDRLARLLAQHVELEVQLGGAIVVVHTHKAQCMRGRAGSSEPSKAVSLSARTARRGSPLALAVLAVSLERSRKIFSSSCGSNTACASEKLPRLTVLPQTSRCTRSIRLEAQRPRMVLTTGLIDTKVSTN